MARPLGRYFRLVYLFFLLSYLFWWLFGLYYRSVDRLRRRRPVEDGVAPHTREGRYWGVGRCALQLLACGLTGKKTPSMLQSKCATEYTKACGGGAWHSSPRSSLDPIFEARHTTTVNISLCHSS